MIPIRDTAKSKTTPVINYILIGACGVVYLYEMTLGPRLEGLVANLGINPARVASTLFHGKVSPHATIPLFTSLFIHGGLIHLMGNMLYLYIFGDNVEDRLGHVGYLIFYVLSGIGAGLTQVYFQQDSRLPLIGASGAIAGVLGAYFLLFPRARVLTVIPLFVFFPVIEVSAFFFLGFWFVLQFIQGSVANGGESIAWWAHAGGFVVGAVMLPFFLLIRRFS